MNPLFDRTKMYRQEFQNFDKNDAQRNCDYDAEHIDHKTADKLNI